MSDKSDSQDVGKILGIVASVIGILAFFGITSCDELKDAVSSSSPSSNDEAATIDDAAVGDCLRLVDNHIYLVSCDDGAAEYLIAARISYDDQAYYKWSGSPNEGGSKAHNAMAGCALEMGYPYRPLFTSDTSRIFWISDNRELLCTERIGQ
ncbi:hypothetical protein [Stackebrandtia soli]|uniref:hypothetical protein n=1 Tax=Stackebrandtia soli TaxID=1892856 RepID=UPI0039E8766A